MKPPPLSHQPLPLLLATRQQGAHDELIRRYRADERELVRLVAGFHLAGYTRHLLARHAEAAGLCEQLEDFEKQEIGRAALRKAALRQLDMTLKNRCQTAVLFKGAALARELYPQEHLRQSADIDILMTDTAIEAVFPGERQAPCAAHDHIRRQHIIGMPLEVHFKVGRHPRWGSFADIAPPDPGPGLVTPDPLVSLTITLQHVYKHYGIMPYDFSDLSLLQAHYQLDWADAAQLWCDRGLQRQVLPALLIAASCGIVPETACEPLLSSVSRRDARRATIFASYLGSTRASFLRRWQLRCWKRKQSVPFTLLLQLFGTRATTQRLTGLPPANPKFWLHHLLIQPANRIARAGRPIAPDRDH